ncbi:ATP-binding protein [Curtanaerobium respiraculi]|uniref:ATP-binding protein n=1 Tax=Curtanaerobium respiraculi TaxID=2949669 RepID=UPI0024B39A54|nr:ATP-binding protein [Curtanaerobium respiraculi]
MLKRKISGYLKAWKESHGDECLLVQGARQVGKSYAIEAFGHAEYESVILIDFVKHPDLMAIFNGSLEPDDIQSRISLLLPGAKYVDGSTLLFLDEIQECPQARSSLKYLAVDRRMDVIASGSLLGIRFRQMENAPSLPVGYERQVTMRPLDFEEYLWARGYDENAIGLLRGYAHKMESVPQAVHNAMMGLLREYIAVGGMPAVVDSFCSGRDFGSAHDAQLMLHDLYLDDIARYAPPVERVKARECYLSLPRQLAKENTKFQYSVVQKKGSARKFDGSVSWIVGAEMALECRSVSMPTFPLESYESDAFRLYANDTGMLMAMYDFEMKAAVVDDTLKGPMKGGLYENLVACMLASKQLALRYWLSSDTKHEIEFLLDGPHASVVPIEVKASRDSTVSLNEMLSREDVRVGYKLTGGNVGAAGKKMTLPLYLGAFADFR